MKKNKKKTLLWTLGIIVFIVIIVIVWGVLQTGFREQNSTQYSSYSISKDGKTLTYSGIWKYERYHSNGMIIRASNYLTDECAFGGGCSFPGGVSHIGYFPFYLELNGIDSSQFHAGGNKPLVCVFQPDDWMEHTTQLWDESDQKYYSVTGDYWGDDYQQIKDIGFSWRGGKFSCFTGDYQLSNLRTHIGKLACYVKSDAYVANGIIGVTGTGYYCTINPVDIPTERLSLSAIVKFWIAREITIYRFEDNQCTQMTILENKITENDYDTLMECELLIVEEEIEEEEIIEDEEEIPIEDEIEEEIIEDEEKPTISVLTIVIISIILIIFIVAIISLIRRVRR